MRRCLHSLLVGVLTFSLSIDAARACGHLRHWRACHRACAAPVVVVVTESVACGGCFGVDGCDQTAFDVADCGCDGAIVAGGLVGCEEIACGAAVKSYGAVVDEPVVASPAAAVETVISPAPAAVVTPTPAPPTPSPIASAVPELEPVEPAAATEPAAEPNEPELTMPAEVAPAQEATAPPAGEPVAAASEPRLEPQTEPESPVPAVQEPAVVSQQEPVTPPQPEPPTAPQPRNVFEEADTGAAESAVPDEPAVDEMPAADEAPAAEPFDMGDAPADAASVEPAIDAGDALDAPEVTEPIGDEPAAGEPEPATDPVADPEPIAAAEPLRRWIDDTASYAVVGRLVDVRSDTVEIEKTDGRSVTVPLARLSGFDRDYVAEVGTRVAAARQRGPHPRETASR